ncbi:hypothetical protein BDM02DRAFT_320358 [Thelephora ganbajun]|uniref:Uncharacterized protein n=1 Tax=Thelephora ganbajun TaxID=370292 RepID=A0ACB6Z977_THEGA|nr:hypothetical protein BDM02DRAFT_320358 [Thelephora ganbajun]
MRNIQRALGSVIGRLSDQNYEQLLDYCRFWFEIGQTYSQIPSDLIFETIWANRETGPSPPGLIYPNAHLILRFASDAESDHILAPYSAGLRSRLYARILQEFFDSDLGVVYNESGYWSPASGRFYMDVNLIAHCTNLGYIDESTIRNHILQPLISHPALHDHHAYALTILFKLAGATLGAYVDPSVVDRCFELLRGHHYRDKGMEQLSQEVAELRKRGWEGLPPPPVFTTGKQKSIGTDQKDPSTTPIAPPLRLPNRDPEPQVPQPSPLESITTSDTDAVSGSPVIRSPSISIASLSDFTIADTSDDESPTDPTILTQHETFYLEDGNVEVLCGNTLFRVHAGVMTFHSSTLHQTFARTSLATADSPDGCPRIISSDKAADFSTLLKVIYIPGSLERNKVLDFVTFSSLLRITAKYEMPVVRSQLLEVVHDAYETSADYNPLGESVFSGPTPHPNEVLNLFVQQKLTSALPLAYYMAVRRGVDSLTNRHLSRNAVLSPAVLQSAIRGLMALREIELNETHRLIFEPKGSHLCSTTRCPSRIPATPTTFEAYQKVFEHVVSSQLGTKVLQFPDLYQDYGGETSCVVIEICDVCLDRWGSGFKDLRKKVWAKLPEVFGLKG